MAINFEGERFIEAAEAAQRLGVDMSTLRKWRAQGRLRWVQSGPRKFFYCEKDIIKLFVEGGPKRIPPGKELLNE